MFHIVAVTNANHRSKSQDEFFDCLHADAAAGAHEPDMQSGQEVATTGQKRKYDSDEQNDEDGSFGDLRDCLLYQSCIRMHKRIPSCFLIEWIANVKSYLFSFAASGGLGDGQEIHIGCSCSGTGIWGRINEMLLLHWQVEYNVGPYVWKHRFMCEVNARKQAP